MRLVGEESFLKRLLSRRTLIGGVGLLPARLVSIWLFGLTTFLQAALNVINFILQIQFVILSSTEIVVCKKKKSLIPLKSVTFKFLGGHIEGSFNLVWSPLYKFLNPSRRTNCIPSKSKCYHGFPTYSRRVGVNRYYWHGTEVPSRGNLSRLFLEIFARRKMSLNQNTPRENGSSLILSSG